MSLRLRTLALAMPLALFALLPALGTRLHPGRYISARGEDTGRLAARNRSAFGQILGEFRTGVADMIFIKTEAYLHSGIRYGLHINRDALASEGKTEAAPGTAADVSAGLDERNLGETEREVAGMNLKPGETRKADDEIEAPLLIPEAKDDIRGFVGELERRVKPWQDPRIPHHHTAGLELLPWYRMMTLADPHNTRGYLIGTWWLLAAKTDSARTEALAFVEEGVANNPEEFQLWTMKGRVLDALARKPEALAAFHEARVLGAGARPAGGPDNVSWSEAMEDDWRAAARFEVFTLRDLGRGEEAQASARDFIRLVGQDRPLEMFLAEGAR